MTGQGRWKRKNAKDIFSFLFCGDRVVMMSVLPLRFGVEASFDTSLRRCTGITTPQMHCAHREKMWPACGGLLSRCRA